MKHFKELHPSVEPRPKIAGLLESPARMRNRYREAWLRALETTRLTQCTGELVIWDHETWARAEDDPFPQVCALGLAGLVAGIPLRADNEATVEICQFYYISHSEDILDMNDEIRLTFKEIAARIRQRFNHIFWRC